VSLVKWITVALLIVLAFPERFVGLSVPAIDKESSNLVHTFPVARVTVS